MMKTNINLLDLDNDILNIIGEKVKKDNLNRELKKSEQILNGKHIRFNEFEYRIPYSSLIIKDKNTISKDSIKLYIFDYVDMEIIKIKNNAKTDKIRLDKDNIRMCIWVCFKRCNFILDDYKLIIDIDDEDNFFEEYLTLKKLNLKTKYSFKY